MFILIFHSLKKWSHGKRHTFQNDGALSLAHQVKNITKLKDLDQDSSHFWGFQMVLLLETQTWSCWKNGNGLFYGLGFFIEQFRGWRCFWCISGKFWGNLLDHLSYHLDPFGSSTLTLVEQQRYQTFSRKLSLRNCFKKSSTYVDLIQKKHNFPNAKSLLIITSKRMSPKGEPIHGPGFFQFSFNQQLRRGLFFGVQGVCKSFGAFEDEAWRK